MKKESGFTLVELLVVIAIIALLMSMLMPALARVNEQAKNVACQVRLRQWGAIYTMYADDYGGYFFPGSNEATGLLNDWLMCLKKYYINKEMALCPWATKPYNVVVGASDNTSLPGPGQNTNHFAWGQLWMWRAMPPELYGMTGSYCFNGYIANPASPAEMWPTVMKMNEFWRSPAVKSAGIVPIMTDGMWMSSAIGTDTMCLEPPAAEGMTAFMTVGGIQRHCVNRHRGTVNSLFLDYSVRPVGLKELWRIKWHRMHDLNSGPRKAKDWPVWMQGFENFTRN